MANIYVRSGATGLANGASWTDAYTTLGAALTAGAAGDTFYVAHDHAESSSGAAVTVTAPLSSTTRTRILCVDTTSGALATTATITVASAHAFTFNTSSSSGYLHIYGITFACGASTTATDLTMLASTSYVRLILERCTFKINGAAASSDIIFGGNGGRSNHMTVIDCQLYFTEVNQTASFNADGVYEVIHTGAVPYLAAGSVATVNAYKVGTFLNSLRFVGVDFTTLSSTASLHPTTSTSMATIVLQGCKLGASQTFAQPNSAAQFNKGGADIIGCDSGAGYHRNERYQFGGTLHTETTIVRTGGATDGTTPFSWKLTSTSIAASVEAFEGVVWNETTGTAKTLTVEIINDATTLTNRDIWLEVEYPSSSTATLTKIGTTLPAEETATANLPTSAEAWTTTGLTTPVKQKLSVTYTPQMKGPIKWRVLARAGGSKVIYVCPKATIS